MKPTANKQPQDADANLIEYAAKSNRSAHAGARLNRPGRIDPHDCKHCNAIRQFIPASDYVAVAEQIMAPTSLTAIIERRLRDLRASRQLCGVRRRVAWRLRVSGHQRRQLDAGTGQARRVPERRSRTRPDCVFSAAGRMAST